MKELLEFERWADKIIANEAIQDRPLARSQDIQYQASRAHPDRSPEQALQLFVANKLNDSEKMDLEQNKLINAQKRENEKLRRSLSDLSSELSSHEQTAMDTEREVQRLRDLSSKLKPAGEIQKQMATADADKVQKMLSDLEQLKNKPGIDDKKFKELSDQVDQIKNNASNVDIARVEKIINQLNSEQTVQDELFNKAMASLEDTKQQLDSKEQRFKDYISKKKGEISQISQSSAEEMKRYADLIDGYKQKIENFDQEIKPLAKKLAPLTQEIDVIQDLRGRIQQDAQTIQDFAVYARELMGMPEVSNPEKVEVDPSQAGQDVVARAQAQSRQTKPVVPSSQQSGRDLREPVNPNELRESKIFEDVRVAKSYANKDYQEWLEEILPVLVKEFKEKYRIELKNKDHLYSDKQIAYTLEEHAPWIWKVTSDENPVLSEQQFSAFLTMVKIDLFSQPPEPEQYDLPLSEGLGNIYERMLDQIIESSFTKK